MLSLEEVDGNSSGLPSSESENEIGDIKFINSFSWDANLRYGAGVFDSYVTVHIIKL